MNPPLRIAIATVLSGAALASLAALSQARYLPPGADDALLRLSWRVRGIRIQECRRLTPEELEALPAHMRREEVCEGRIAPYRLRVRVDGRLLEDTLVHAAGAREDRPVYVFREFPVGPGVHRVEIEFVRSVGRGQGEGEGEGEGGGEGREWRDEGSGRDRDRGREGGRRDDRGREADAERGAGLMHEADQRGLARDDDRAREEERARQEKREREGERDRGRERGAAHEDDRRRDRSAARRRNGESPARLELEATVDLAAGDVALITYDPERRALVVRRGARTT